jgi:hypothetical protein
MWKGRGIGVTRKSRCGTESGTLLRKTSAPRLAWTAVCILLALAAVSFSFARDARAQQCDVGNVLCEDGCYAMGAQCCQGGGACNAGYNCWRGTSSSGTFCCPSGTYGTNDGYCIPNGFPEYCGGGHYCVVGVCAGGGMCRVRR